MTTIEEKRYRQIVAAAEQKAARAASMPPANKVAKYRRKYAAAAKPSTDAKAFGYELRRRRLAAGLSLRRLADQVGLSFSTIARIERGDSDYSGETMDRIKRWMANGEKTPGKVRPKAWMERVDARLDRIESAIGLPPLEES